MKKLLITALLFLCLKSLFAYDTGKKPYLSGLLSLAVPGAGQFYNETYIKSAVIFATESTLIGLAFYHDNRMTYYLEKTETYDENFDKNVSQYNKYFNRRQSDFWWLGTVVFVSVVDAFVEANLYNFDQERKDIDIKFSDKKLIISYNF